MTDFSLSPGQGFPDQDWIKLGGKRPPGIAVVRGAGTPRKWDKRAGYGITGAYLVFTGDDLASFEIDIIIWDEEHWTEWLAFAPVLEKPKAGQRPKAIGIMHPLVNRPPWRITSVVVDDVLQFEPDADGEIWICTIKVTPFKGPAPALSKPTAAIPGASAPVPTAQDAADKKIQALTQEMAGLL